MSTVNMVIEAAVPVASIGAAWITGVLANRSGRITAAATVKAADAEAAADRNRVEAEAYGRAKGIYESALRSLERQAKQLQEQLDAVSLQLSQERDQSTELRAQVRQLEDQVRTLSATIADMRREIAVSAVTAAEQVHGAQEGSSA